MKDGPHSIIFFPNGMASVCDERGEQMAKYQGSHREALEALKADGFDWRTMDVTGSPNVFDYEKAL